MSSPPEISMTTQISQLDQIHLVVDAGNSYEPTVGIPVWSCERCKTSFMDVLQKLNLTAMPATTEVFQNDSPGTTLRPLGEVAAPHADAQKLEGQLVNAGIKSDSDSTAILSGEGDISQTHISEGLALRQDNLAPTCRVFDVSRREVDHGVMELHAKLQSALQHMVELERCLGVVRDNRFDRRERIQLGLEVFVTGKHGVSAPKFPFMMIILALIVVIIPSSYKYYASSA